MPILSTGASFLDDMMRYYTTACILLVEDFTCCMYIMSFDFTRTIHTVCMFGSSIIEMAFHAQAGYSIGFYAKVSGKCTRSLIQWNVVHFYMGNKSGFGSVRAVKE